MTYGEKMFISRFNKNLRKINKLVEDLTEMYANADKETPEPLKEFQRSTDEIKKTVNLDLKEEFTYQEEMVCYENTKYSI